MLLPVQHSSQLLNPQAILLDPDSTKRSVLDKLRLRPQLLLSSSFINTNSSSQWINTNSSSQ